MMNKLLAAIAVILLIVFLSMDTCKNKHDHEHDVLQDSTDIMIDTTVADTISVIKEDTL